MIRIQGDSFNFNEFASQYSANSVEGNVLRAMENSNSTYSFNSLSLLEFELSLRRELVLAAEALNKSRLAFAVFHDSRCNKEYWTRTQNGGFLLKNNVSGADAIEDIYKNGSKYATECATAMVIVHYKALLEVYKKRLFDDTFKSIYLMDWEIRQSLLQEISRPRKVEQLLEGDRGYFRNPDVDPQTPWWQGENVIVLPNQLYYGHGVGIRTAEEIIKSLNSARRRDSSTSAYLMDSAARPNYQRLYNVFASADLRADEDETSLVNSPPLPEDEEVRTVENISEDREVTVISPPKHKKEEQEQSEIVNKLAPPIKISENASPALDETEQEREAARLAWKNFPKTNFAQSK